MHLLAFSVSTASAYTLHLTESGDVVRWPTFPVVYTVEAGGHDAFDPSIVRRAFDAWEGGAGTDITFEEIPDADNVVWVSEDWPFDEDLLAITSSLSDTSGNLVRFDIRINGAQRWATDGSDDAYDLQAAIVHEVGHALGIEHSEFEDATMFATMGHGDTSRREIHTDDEDALAFLYIHEEPAPPPADPPLLLSCSTGPSPTVFAWLVGLIALVIRRRA